MENISTEEKFHSAVALIKSLPKSGSIQPSNDTKLKFYSYYKQATQGPCDVSKPSFWDVVNRAKWDAWNSLGHMSREEAMQGYIQEFVKIIEATPVNNLDNASVLDEYVQLMGPYIVYAPKEIQEKHLLMTGKSINNNSEDYTNSLKDMKKNTVFNDKDIHPPLNGNGVNGGSNESDSDEFSDTLERVNDGEWEEESRKGQSIKRARGGGDIKRGDKSSPLGSQGRVAFSSSTQGNVSNTIQASLPGPSGQSGSTGGGSRRNGGDSGAQIMSSDIGQQLTLSILQMHQTMEQVVQRLNALETLLMSQNAQNQVKPYRRYRWSIFGVHPTVAFLIFAWPFIVQWIVFVIRKRQRRI